MLAGFSVVLAVAIATAVILLQRRMPAVGGPASGSQLLTWSTFVFGVIGCLATAVPLVLSRVAAPEGAGFGSSPLLPVLAIGSSFAATAIGSYAIAAGNRHWATWVGLVAGAAGSLFWLVFLVGELAFPH